MGAAALRCPYCHCGFDPNDEIIRCSRCCAIHHLNCWYETSHCSVFGCPGDAYQSYSIPPLIQIIAPIVLLFLALSPNNWSVFAPLLISALLCSIIVMIHFIGDLIHGEFRFPGRHPKRIAIGICNLIAIYYCLTTFFRL
jgi:hypothetical protein